MKCSLTTKKPGAKAAKRATAKAGATPVEFNITDNGDLTYAVEILDAAGAVLTVDPATVSMTATSDNTSALTADAPVGLTGAVHVPVPAPAVGATANITLTVTWADASAGPFSIVWPFGIEAGGPAGIQVVPGTPTVH
jgi:hypothetical protein